MASPFPAPPQNAFPSTQEFEQIMQGMIVNDTNIVARATDTLNRLLNYAETVPLLVHILQFSQHPEMRQLASVLLRKRICGLWGKMPEETRRSVQATLLQAVAYEQVSIVRKSTTELVAVLGRMTLAVGQWPELLPFLHQCTQTENPSLKEVFYVYSKCKLIALY